MKTNDWKAALGALMPETPQPQAQEPEPQPEPKKEPAKPKLHIELDRKRAGKTATIIYGFEPDDPRVDEVATTLKRKLAVGGSARDGEILLQGDHVQRATQALHQMGYKV